MSDASAAARKKSAHALFAGSAYDPTAAGGLFAWQRPGGVALLRRPEGDRALPGSHPALGGTRIAWRDENRITIADAATLDVIDRFEAPGADVLAVSDSTVVWRTRDEAGTDRLFLGAGQLILESRAPNEIGRPALAGNLLLCHIAGPRGSRILGIDLATGVHTVLRTDPLAQVSNPSTDGTRLLYVHATGVTQQLRVGPLAAGPPANDTPVLIHASPGRRDKEHEPGRHRHRAGYPGRRRAPLPPRSSPGVVATLWSTALVPGTALVTRLRVVRGKGRSADILSVPA
jgi:hypothetical protein